MGSEQSNISFCDAHKTGYWCHDSSRVRCCKLEDGGHAKCGSVANSTSCGWKESPSTDSQVSSNSTLSASWFWRIHRGWHTSSFCRSHHVGRFCSSHHVIHCCNDYGHYVECNSQYRSESWCYALKNVFCICFPTTV